MTSTEVKNQMRDGFENGIDQIHKFADLVTFPLAPLDGAIHGIARGGFNWLLDKHPKDQTKSAPEPAYNQPTGGYGCPPAAAPGYGYPPGGGGYGTQPAGGGYETQPGGYGYKQNDNAYFSVEDNKIQGNRAGRVGVTGFGNQYY